MKTTPKDFFLHLGAIATLYISAISLITLLFQIVNVAFPDIVYGYVDPYSSGIRWAIASLLIIFPLFILLSWLLEREYKQIPDKRTLPVKRWLTFFTLFLTGAAIAVDLIVLINSFLGGETTTRFFLKVAAVLVVTGGVFGYYLWDLRRNVVPGDKRPKIFAIVAVVAVVASIVGGFLIMGSPTTQRELRLDEQKIGNLQEIQSQVTYYWQMKRVLPAKIEDLNSSLTGFYAPTDPETGMNYEYKKVSDLSFELCADFNREASQTASTAAYYPKIGAATENWQHGVGRTCFTRTIDPALYPALNR